MNLWQKKIRDGIDRPETLAARFDLTPDTVLAATSRYPMRINRYWLEQIRRPFDPLYLQAVPDARELRRDGLADPLAEEALSPAACIVHKYPDRVLFLVSNNCAMYCRFCTRKRMVGSASMRCDDDAISAGLEYIRKTDTVREVLLSGGDPLMLSDTRLEAILSELYAIPHVEVLRIGTRIPSSLPMRVTAELAAMLSRFQPLYINTHFNHPAELTVEAAAACALLADAGISLGCQTVLLKGVNDNTETMRLLLTGLLALRVRPYYLHQLDFTRGTSHFRVPIRKGLEIMAGLIGHISGMAIPTYAIDLPGGGGKIPLFPDYAIPSGDDSLADELRFRNFRGEEFSVIDTK